MGARVRVSFGENREEWEEEEQVGVVLACLASEGAGSACGREATWRHGARAHCGDRKETMTVLQGAPWHCFPLFLIFFF